MSIADTDTKKITTSLCHALYDGIREGAAIIEVANKKFIYCNKAFLELFGFDKLKQLNITQFRKLRKYQLSDEAISAREKILQENGRYTELVEYTSLKGQSFFGEVIIHGFVRNDKYYYLFAVNPVDKAFFELSSIGILLMNTIGEIVTINRYVLQQFGYEKNELIGRKVEMLIPERYRQSHVTHRENFITLHSEMPMGSGKDLLAVKKDGTEFPVEISLSKYPSADNKYIITFISDISERKNAEAEARKLHGELESKVEHRTQALQTLLHQLETSKADLEKVSLFHKALLDNAGAIIVSVDTNGIIQTFNPEAERQLGYKAEELIGIHTPVFFHDSHPQQQHAESMTLETDRMMKADLELLFDKARQTGRNELEWYYVRKNGTKFPVRLSVTPMKDAQGIIRGFMGIAFDISGTKKIELELNEALEKEKELNELKSRFVTMASHEFRTPLSTILSSAYLIEKYVGTEDQPKRKMHLQRVISSVSMLTDILNDFLSVGKIEEGKIQVRFAYINICKIVKEAIDTIENTLKANQRIQYHHEGCEEAFLDPSLLKHIILNLSSNASKFSTEGKLIQLSTINADHRLVLSVKDYGMGIAKSDQQHLMERFFRGANAGNIQGTGLGLHIVAKYAELMNGTVECKSELEKGTEFIITFNNK